VPDGSEERNDSVGSWAKKYYLTSRALTEATLRPWALGVSTLVRKGLLTQEADPSDQRQRILRITDAGTTLWDELPDPLAVAAEVAFGDIDPADLATARRVLQEATRHLNEHIAPRP
jgi:hypothetical protein